MQKSILEYTEEIKEMITEKDIKENLKNVEEGKPLTIPLAVLDGKFKRVYYRKSYRKDINKEEEREYYRKKWRKKYPLKFIICPICKKEFLQSNRNQILCSQRCINRKHNLKRKR